MQQWYRLQEILFPWYEQLNRRPWTRPCCTRTKQFVVNARVVRHAQPKRVAVAGVAKTGPGNGCWRRVRKRLGRRGGWRANDLDAVADVPRDDVPHTFLCSADQVAAPIRDVYAAELIGGCGGARGVRADVAAGDDIGVAADRDSIAGESLNVQAVNPIPRRADFQSVRTRPGELTGQDDLWAKQVAVARHVLLRLAVDDHTAAEIGGQGRH